MFSLVFWALNLLLKRISDGVWDITSFVRTFLFSFFFGYCVQYEKRVVGFDISLCY